MRMRNIWKSLLAVYVIGVTSVLLFICLITFSGQSLHVAIEMKQTPSDGAYVATTNRKPDEIKYFTNHSYVVENIDQRYLVGNSSRTNAVGEQLSFCGINVSKEMDLLKMNKLPFINSYKNPCWRRRDGKLRCLPYMYLVGVAKCGTTDLFSRITQHPDFIAPSIKETNWLSSGRFWRQESFDYFSSSFFSPLIKVIEADRTHPKLSRMITGEASINTITGAHAWKYLGNNVGKGEPVENNPEYIHHLFNETRILINVRNPVDRLWSEYLAFSRSRHLSAERFHEIVETSLRTYSDCMASKTLRSCMYDRYLWNNASMNDTEVRLYGSVPCRMNPTDIVMLQRGVYHVYIQDYLRVFKRDHVLIQRLEDMSEDPEKSLALTYSFLGLRPLSPAETNKIVNAKIKNTKMPGRKKVGNMLPKTRDLLYRFYKPHNEILAKMLNDKLYDYGPVGG